MSEVRHRTRTPLACRPTRFAALFAASAACAPHASATYAPPAASRVRAAAGAPASAPAPSTTPPATSPADDPLRKLNEDVRGVYRAARARALAAAGPIVLSDRDTLVLLRGGTRDEARVVPPEYHTLKEIDHIALGIGAVLSTGGGSLDEARRAELVILRDDVDRVLPSLDALTLPAAAIVRGRFVMTTARTFLSRTLTAGEADAAAFDAFVAAITPALRENVVDAARARIDGINERMRAWRRSMSAGEWASLHVVVMGAHMARDGEVSLQYFLRALGEPAEGGRVIFAESVGQEKDALGLLGTHLLDGAIARRFFGDPKRLHRDVLADAARAHLDEITLP